MHLHLVMGQQTASISFLCFQNPMRPVRAMRPNAIPCHPMPSLAHSHTSHTWIQYCAPPSIQSTARRALPTFAFHHHHLLLLLVLSQAPALARSP